MKLQEFACPNCHAPLVPIKDARYMFCDYCGTRIVIDDIEYYREDSKTERKRMQIDADVRKHEIDMEAKTYGQEKRQETLLLILMTIMIVAFLIFGIFATH